MIWRRWPLGEGERRACRLSGRTLVPICMVSIALATVAVAMLVRPAIAAASGSGTLTFTPSSGSPGTLVTVTISAEPPGPTPYVLSVSPTNPAANACAGGLRLADAPKIIVMPDQPTTTTFFWPADVSSDAYYLCANPAGGQEGPTVWSQQPFSVTSGTPTRSSAIAQVTDGGVMAGGVLSLLVDTAALGGDTPQQFSLIQPGQSGGVSVNWLLAGMHLTVYTYDVSIPADTSPGTYEIRVTAGDGSHAATSNTFQVVSFGTSRGGSQRTSSPPLVAVPGTSAISPAGALLVAIIALLLAIAIVSLVGPLVRRRQPERRPPGAPLH